MTCSERPHPEARSVGLGRQAEALTGREISVFRDDGRPATGGAHRPARVVGKSPGVVEFRNLGVTVPDLWSGVSLPVLGWAIA